MGEHNLFQTELSQGSELHQVLKQELQSFNDVLQFSNKFVSEIESLPVDVLSNMINFRQKWVEQIQMLEKKRKTLQVKANDEQVKAYLKNISDLASKIVEIDKTIYKNLQKRKLKFVQNYSTTSSQARSFTRQVETKDSGSQRVDIVQE